MILTVLIVWVLFLLSFLIGYYIGYRHPDPASLSKTLTDSLTERPKPGVVQTLSPQEIADKHDPKKQGNKEAFDRLFAKYPAEKLQE